MLAKYCIWDGTPKGATFMSMNNTLYTMVSRTCEAAGLRKDQVTMKMEEEFMFRHEVPCFSVERHKTLSHQQDMSFYPHRDSMLQDMVFALGYHLVMNDDCGKEALFYPAFASKLKNDKNELDTATARLFQQYYDSITSIVKRYEDLMEDDEFGEHSFVAPAKYSGHTPKKCGVNKLADFLHIQIFVFRAGWMVKNMHSAFDYILNSKQKDRLCAKVLANWLVKMGDDYVGGIPPSGEAIFHKWECYEKFVNELFSAEVHLDICFKRMLTASILRWYEYFVSLVKEEPLRRFTNHHNHPFISHLIKAAADVGLTEEDIIEWSKVVKRDFISKNCLAIPMSTVSKAYGDNQKKPTDTFCVDTRPMIQVVKDISNISAMNAMHNIRLSSEINQLTSIVKQQNTLLRDLTSEVTELKQIIGVKRKMNLLMTSP